jgi:hypothetical protein
MSAAAQLKQNWKVSAMLMIPNIKYENPFICSRVVVCGQREGHTNGHGEANKGIFAIFRSKHANNHYDDSTPCRRAAIY